MSHHIVEASALGHEYPGGIRALHDISFRIEHGESVGIAGANGAGKSTLLLHFTALLLPTAGGLNIGGYPVSQTTTTAIRRAVGMTFQNPDDQLFMPTVFDDVAFGPLNQGLPPEEATKRAEDALATVGAAHLRDRSPHLLSGGEKRAVSIATVLSMSPDILVMDEPSAGLDPRSRRRLIGILKCFTHTRVIASHDLDLLWDICPRMMLLKDGTIIADGPTERILTDEKLLTSAGLEKPLRLQGCPVCHANTSQDIAISAHRTKPALNSDR